MTLVDRTKKEQLELIRDNGQEDHLNTVTLFMAKYNCDIPNMKYLYVSHIGHGRRMVRDKAPQVVNLLIIKLKFL